MHRMIAGFVTVLQWKSKEKLPKHGKNRPKQGKFGRFGEFYPSFSMSYRLLIFISPLILKMVGRMPEQSLFADHIFDMERILDKGGDLTFFAIYACAVLLMSLLCLFLAWKRFQVDR